MLADVTFTTETLAVVGLLLAPLLSAIGVLFYKLVAAIQEDRDNWKQMAGEAVGDLEKAARQHLRLTGRKPVKALAPVVPEHSSPATKSQKRAAELQTTRAHLVAAKLALGLEPRNGEVDEESPKGTP